MRKIFGFLMVTLDGYHETSDGDLSWHNVDAEVHEFAVGQLDEADTLLFGRRTYEHMAAFWPTAAAMKDPDADPDELRIMVNPVVLGSAARRWRAAAARGSTWLAPGRSSRATRSWCTGRAASDARTQPASSCSRKVRPRVRGASRTGPTIVASRCAAASAAATASAPTSSRNLHTI
jgi:hypothetical protein